MPLSQHDVLPWMAPNCHVFVWLLFCHKAINKAIILFAIRSLRVKEIKKKTKDVKEKSPTPANVTTEAFGKSSPEREAKSLWMWKDVDRSKSSKSSWFDNQDELDMFCYKLDQRAFVLFFFAFTLFHGVYAVVYLA